MVVSEKWWVSSHGMYRIRSKNHLKNKQKACRCDLNQFSTPHMISLLIRPSPSFTWSLSGTMSWGRPKKCRQSWQNKSNGEKVKINGVFVGYPKEFLFKEYIFEVVNHLGICLWSRKLKKHTHSWPTTIACTWYLKKTLPFQWMIPIAGVIILPTQTMEIPEKYHRYHRFLLFDFTPKWVLYLMTPVLLVNGEDWFWELRQVGSTSRWSFHFPFERYSAK